MRQTEFKYLQRAIAAGTAAPQLHDLTMVSDQITRWQFKLKGFDDDVPGALSAWAPQLVCQLGCHHCEHVCCHHAISVRCSMQLTLQI